MPPDPKLRGALPSGPQLRSYPAQFEVRSLTGTMVELTGYASTYEQPYEMFDMFGPYTEVARAGMCAKTLAEGADVAYLANHEGLTMARTKSGSLRLAEDPTGMLAVAQVNTARSDVRDLVTAVEDKNVDEMSFAFRVVAQAWSPDWEQRDLIEVNLNKGDVSAVNYGANPGTSLDLQRAFRSLRGARAHRMAVELQESRAGKALSSATADVLAQVLELCATADDAMDLAQPMLADLMGVANPDTPGDAEDALRAAAFVETLRRRHEHEADRPRFVVGL